MNDTIYIVKIGLASCGIAAGATSVYQTFEAQMDRDHVSLIPTGCLGVCYCEPLVEVISPSGESVLYGNVTPKDAQQIMEQHINQGMVVQHLLAFPQDREDPEWDYFNKQTRFALQNCGVINPEDINSYTDAGGYQGLKKSLMLGPELIIKELEQAGLRGRGGAGFPTYRKWQLTRQAVGKPKYVVCNADEGDPGAFMDRSILESDPHSVIEGLLIAGYAIGATQGYFYVRAEYPLAIKRLRIALDQVRAAKLLGTHILDTDFSFEIDIREGAGAFVCGEETALLMSIEGRRGMPRFRPPYPAEKGLFHCPTAINNVETLANVPRIMYQGHAAYSKHGTEQSKGTKVFALAGKVNRGGLVEIPMGMNVNELVFAIGGGISTGKPFKAIQTGGPSGGCIPAELGETPVDYENLAQIGAIMGSGGLLVMDEDTCMIDVAKFFLHFAREESCGKCTFCRIGTEKMLQILTRISQGEGKPTDIQVLADLGQKIQVGSMCGLGQSVPNPVLTTLKYFRQEYEAHIDAGICPAKQCKSLIDYQIVTETCRSCNLCVISCPVKAISGKKGQAYQINETTCVRCGLCLDSCRFNAIRVTSLPTKHTEATTEVI